MAKLFCISDVHGYYEQMRKALDEAGFDPNDESHWLIVCGDLWDRGNHPFEVMKYIRSLPHKVIIRGNHEDLFEQCCDRGEAWGYDFSNGTYATICELGNAGEGYDFPECCQRAEVKTRVFRENMVNYFETQNYIFVHAWVPLNCDSNLPPYYLKGKNYTKMENWREANAQQWEDARWGNPFEFAKQGLQPDKVIVFGHFHTSWARHQYNGESEWTSTANFNPYYGEGYIGIDACCAHSGKINCLVLEDDFINGES